jgi:hypothetical protein
MSPRYWHRQPKERLVLLGSRSDVERNTISSPALITAEVGPVVHVVPPGGTVHERAVSLITVYVPPLCSTIRTPLAGAGMSTTTRSADAIQVKGATLAVPSGVVVSGPNGLSGLVWPTTVW